MLLGDDFQQVDPYQKYLTLHLSVKYISKVGGYTYSFEGSPTPGTQLANGQVYMRLTNTLDTLSGNGVVFTSASAGQISNDFTIVFKTRFIDNSTFVIAKRNLAGIATGTWGITFFRDALIWHGVLHGSNQVQVNYNTIPAVNSICYFKISRKDGVISIYINGVKQSATINDSTDLSNAEVLRIGRWDTLTWGGNIQFNDLKIYNGVGF